MLTAFCEYNDIPRAPFFLRDLGLDTEQWIKQDTAPYKKDHIERIMAVYHQLAFILIGDSGQQDPEIYWDIHQKHPGRVKAIYIRHVYTAERKNELEEMARKSDIPFLVMPDSHSALNHAREQGWITAKDK